MNKRQLVLPLLALVSAAAFSGCQKTDATATTPAPTVEAPPVTAAPPAVTPAPSRSVSGVSETPLRDALNTLFEREAAGTDGPFPQGTHLLNVDVKDKTATVDVSKEFNQLQNRGESGEGQAQKHLCATLAQFPTVETLHLTVEGKDYESQAADWRSIPVRPEAETSGQPGNLRTAGGASR